MPAGIRERDPARVGWWLLEGIATEAIDAQRARVVASVLRVVSGLGKEVLTTEEAMKQSVLFGRLAHGIPPEDDEEWALAESLFAPEAMADFRMWETGLAQWGGAVAAEYTVIVESSGWDDEEGRLYVARCPEVPGSRGEGQSVEGAREDLVASVVEIIREQRRRAIHSAPDAVYRGPLSLDGYRTLSKDEWNAVPPGEEDTWWT